MFCRVLDLSFVVLFFFNDTATTEIYTYLHTLSRHDALPIWARYWGVEAQGSATLASFGDWALSADALADYVRATLSDVGPAPRIPPLRLLGGLELKKGDVWGRSGGVDHATRQDSAAAHETPTQLGRAGCGG